MKKLLFIAGCICLLAGCGHQSPQTPSRRKGGSPQPAPEQMALLEFNRQMTEAADRQLAELVKKQDAPYAMYEAGTWGLILDPGDTASPAPRPNEEWTVHMRVKNLEGRMLQDSEGTYRIGRQELPDAVERNIREWHRGCRVRLYAPWYAAFGLRGTAAVPPYENVIIEIELK